jgi:short-subunit dehydrogenase
MVETHKNIASSNDRYIVITGCSSGIGKESALLLASQGFKVFATVRKEKDAKSLKDSNNRNIITIYPLDLTKTDDIAKSVQTIKTELSQRGIRHVLSVPLLLHNH